MQNKNIIGTIECKVEVATQMLINGFDMEDIYEVTGMAMVEIEKINDRND